MQILIKGSWGVNIKMKDFIAKVISKDNRDTAEW